MAMKLVVNTEYKHERVLRSRGTNAVHGLPESFKLISTMSMKLSKEFLNMSTLTKHIKLEEKQSEVIYIYINTLHGLSESQIALTNLLTLLEHVNLRCVNPFRDCLVRLLSDASKEESGVCLISDAILHFIGPGLKLPRLVLQTGRASFFLAFAAFLFLLEKGCIPVQDSWLEEPIPELPPLRVKDIPVINASNPELFYQLLADMVIQIKNFFRAYLEFL
ncbi:hypothetical protein HYC85_000806 [Camellia sinensis]|uniref:Uncharacterized protein n=1 Tax=Camellia sinensis TaxID=4442 RepID=A0A7J7I4P9_CAMSI|nr:hypothetical protein HYC85_000806 [Camellia sinensis]